MLEYIDSHAHYDDSAFDDDRDLLLPQLHKNGVLNIINIGCSEKSCASSAALADKYDFIYFAAGIHPDEASSMSDSFRDTVKKYASHKKCAAIGEIGLDYHYDGYDRSKQIALFEMQLEIAAEYGLPVVIHTRDAWQDTMDILKRYRPKGVVHCYSGSAETAEEIVNLGMYIGFTGVLTFKNAKKAVKSADVIPLSRILVETDCPYMAPEPFRGTRCDSGMITEVIKKGAEIKKISPEEFAAATVSNTRRLFPCLENVNKY